MSIRRILSILFTLTAVATYAQVKIQGKVLDAATGNPVPYADVRLPELKVGATTNSDGTFYVESPNNTYKLIISKSGYKLFEYEIVEKIDFNFIAELEEAPSNEDDYIDDSGEGIALQTATVTGKKKTRLKKKENPP